MMIKWNKNYIKLLHVPDGRNPNEIKHLHIQISTALCADRDSQDRTELVVETRINRGSATLRIFVDAN